ncbi:MAG TPA: hypothetical protein VKU41_13940, partial [Polyangiaceae bacterium]|nr:hypothetical protein [Polyangiaceae bacterium]
EPPAAPPAPLPPPAPALPPPSSASSGGAGFDTGTLTGTPNPNALGGGPGDEWRFSSHGYFRAPLRVGVGQRPACGAGQAPGTEIMGGAGTAAPTSVPCAGPGQSTTSLHSPFLPDDQYLDWRYTRQWEQDWAEIFLNYGNSRVVGTVGLQAYNFTDAGFTDANAQFGIAQGYATITPDLGLPNVRLKWKVGSFWEKYGGAGQYDAGMYDTYLFGRIHQVGEAVAAEMDVGDYTFRLSHGIGARLEQVPAGTSITPLPSSTSTPGFTLLNHLHAGASYKKVVDLNFHFLAAWAQDARATPASPDGKINVGGGEVRVNGNLAGNLYAGYSHVDAVDAGAVGPVIEVIHSLGGGGHGTGYGLIDNYLGPCSKCAAADVGKGSIDTVEVMYTYSFGLLYRKLQDPNATFWGDGSDLRLSVVGMYTAVSSKDPTADGVKKLKYGADLVYTPLPWLGFGARADVVQPSSKDSSQRFWVISPKILVKTKFVTHEEITAQYSHYSYSSGVSPQPPNSAYPPDPDVFGVKATMWW